MKGDIAKVTKDELLEGASAKFLLDDPDLESTKDFQALMEAVFGKELAHQVLPNFEAFVFARQLFGEKFGEVMFDAAEALIKSGHKVNLQALFPQLKSSQDLADDLTEWRRLNKVPDAVPHEKVLREYFSITDRI